MSYLSPYIKRYGALFLLAVVFLSGEALCDLLQPTIMSRVVDVGVAHRDLHFVLAHGVLMLMVAGLGALSASGRNIVSSNVSQRFGADVRSDLYRVIMSLRFSDLDRFSTATLVNRVTNDVTQLQNFVNGMMRIFVKAPLVAIGSIVMAILLDERLARVLEVVLPIVAALIFLSLRMGYPRYRVVQRNLDNVNGIFREYLAGARVVKAFNRFDYEAERFSAANAAMARATTRAMRVMAVFTPGIAVSINLGLVAVLWLGGAQVDAGRVGPGHIIAFVNYMTQILVSVSMIAMIFNTFVRARASSERLGEVFGAAPSPDDALPSGERASRHAAATVPSPGKFGNGARGSIAFESVTFAYSADTAYPALAGVSFRCEPGELVGVIGSTGSGKTTLVCLIPRFRDATSGVVRVDGRDVRDEDQRRLRDRIALVPQQTILFTGTVRENILWGRQGAGDAEIERAARIAQAHDFITRLDDGYGARIGRGGVNLSGGQKQRVAIARAVIREPDILILDDSSSALDAVTEANLREALRRERAGMTVVLVAQRITSVVAADRILVLDDGRVAGLGTHRELMHGCEVYQDIYRSQIGRDEVPRV